MLLGDFDDDTPIRTRIMCPRIGCTGHLFETKGYMAKKADLVDSQFLFKPSVSNVLACDLCYVLFPDIVPRREK